MTMQVTAASEHHPTAWYGQMSGREKSAFWASIGGWILDAMDVQILSFVFPAIIAAFAISNADAANVPLNARDRSRLSSITGA